jgi:hypothetical protein
MKCPFIITKQKYQVEDPTHLLQSQAFLANKFHFYLPPFLEQKQIMLKQKRLKVYYKTNTFGKS